MPADESKFELAGDFAACGRRVSFPTMGKKPMAQATFSCPFGAIHLEDRRGTAPKGHRSGAPSRPPYPLWPFGPSPPDRGSRPPVPHYGGRQLGKLVHRRKGAGGSVDTPPLVFRSRSLSGMRESGTPLFESAFVAVGLKLCSGARRAGEGTRPYGVSEGAFDLL